MLKIDFSAMEPLTRGCALNFEVIGIETSTAFRQNITTQYSIIDELFHKINASMYQMAKKKGIDLEQPCDGDEASSLRLYIGHNYVSPSSPALHSIFSNEFDSLVILIPNAGQYKPYTNLIHPFNMRFWIILIIVFLIYTFLWFGLVNCLTRKPIEYRDLLLDTLRLQLNAPLHRSIQQISEKFFVIGFILYSFIILNSYQSVMISFLMSPRYKPNLNTLAAINESGIKILTSKEYLDILQRLNVAEFLRNEFIESNVSIWDVQPSLIGDYGFLTNLLEARLFIRTNINFADGYPLLHLVDESIFFSTAHFFLADGNPLLEIINDLLNRFWAYGIKSSLNQNQFIRDSRKDIKLLNIKYNKVIKKQSVGTRGMLEIRIALGLLGLGWAVSFFVFLIELAQHKVRMFIRVRQVKRRKMIVKIFEFQL